MEPRRPDPDALLATVPSEKRGRLKLYLGMAAGVGKTYAMLSDAREAKKRGDEVVIGYLEPHDRPDTIAQAEGLEVISPKLIEHKGVRLAELNVEAVIEAGSAICLVDELAHSNAPGSRHAKRWQDIEDLLDAGIEVWTTVNIQHIESLRDIIAQVTGVFVQETVPDSFIERADEIELVDIPPEALQQRLREGKIYAPEKIEQALSQFFGKGNLLALRELALRHTAERVDEELLKSRRTQLAVEPWHARERILVCVAPNSMARRIVRASRRLATSLKADFLAVSVSSPRQSPSEQGKLELEAAMTLAEQLGAKTATLAGGDVVGELIRFAQSENVTTIVMGKPIKPRWREYLFGSVVDHTVRASGDIDVLVVTGKPEKAEVRPAKNQGKWDWRGSAEALLWVAAASWLGVLVETDVQPANVIMLYLIGVVAVSLRYDRFSSMVCALGSVLAYNFYFTEPRYTLHVYDFRDLITFGVMLAVSLILSSLTARLKEQNRALSERERNTGALYSLSQALAATRSKTEMARSAVGAIRTLTGADAAVLRVDSSGSIKVLEESELGFEKDAKESAVGEWVIEHGKPAGATTNTLAGSAGWYLPLRGAGKTFGAIAVKVENAADWRIDKRHLVEAIANQLTTAIERAQFAKESHQATLKAESEQLRSDLLSSVSHDLRTPLASITGSASVLEIQPELTSQSRELAATIREESNRLERLVRNLLDMTRIQGKVELKLDWYALDEVVESAVSRTADLFDQPVQVESPSEPIMVKVDGLLIEQVLVNLLENASRHAGRHTGVTIRLSQAKGFALIEFEDQGPGISPDRQPHVFDRFESSGAVGSGLGLAIAKAAVEAHGGTLDLIPSAVGAQFEIRIPLGEEVDDE
ncbi:MAG: sensor histidine kinase KdpD [Fimbriimonadaceae bacterium]|nr:MAG: sensor histidine kinase KdpD [Fimbriimonadaceae bacterium]